MGRPAPKAGAQQDETTTTGLPRPRRQRPRGVIGLLSACLLGPAPAQVCMSRRRRQGATQAVRVCDCAYTVCVGGGAAMYV